MGPSWQPYYGSLTFGAAVLQRHVGTTGKRPNRSPQQDASRARIGLAMHGYLYRPCMHIIHEKTSDGRVVKDWRVVLLPVGA